MRIQFGGVSFSSRTAAGSAPPKQQRDITAAGGQQAAEGRAAQQDALVAGQPLPDLGACKHYRHSHRWLRFPCCGMRFACDLCHEEGTDGHEMKWATRMVCGHCSVEQPVGSRCASCNKRLASSANKSLSGRPTRFWEGGQGCRDPKRLDRRDAHKHRGSKLKTESKKATRVGQEGKQRRQRGQRRAEA